MVSCAESNPLTFYNSFTAFVWLNTINGDDDTTVGAGLLVPDVVVGDGLARTQQRAVGVKQVENFAPRNGRAEGCEPRLQGRMDLVHGLVAG